MDVPLSDYGGFALGNSHKHKGLLAEKQLHEKMLSAYLLVTYLVIFN